MKTDLFPETIKIGAHTLAIGVLDEEDGYASFFHHVNDRISLMPQTNALNDIANEYLLVNLINRIIWAISVYSYMASDKINNDTANKISHGILETLKSNLLILDVDSCFISPGNVSACGMKYKIVYPQPKQHKGSQVLAYCDPKRNIIDIYDNANEVKVTSDIVFWIALWHEIFHAILNVYENELYDDECVVTNLSEWWVMVLRDNPEFVKCIKNILSDNGKEQDDAEG